MAAAGGKAGAVEEPLPPGVVEDLDGLPVSAEFAAQLEALDLTAGQAPAGGPAALIVQVSPRKTPLPEVARAAELFGAKVRPLHVESFWQPLEPPDLSPLTDCLKEFLLEARR
jgi:hypothetical protein